MRRVSDGCHCRTGSVLILALWALLFLVTLSIGASLMVRQDIRALDRLEARSALYDIASSGAVMVAGIFTEKRPDDPHAHLDTLNDYWADDPAAFKDQALTGGRFSLVVSAADNIAGREKERYGIIDEDRKINLNSAPAKVLENVFAVLGGVSEPEAAKHLAAAVIDWRDPDTVAGDGAAGFSEADAYAALGCAYAPANKPFSSTEELLLIPGVTSRIYFAVRDAVTAYGGGKVNINTAPRDVLRCLDLTDELVDKIVYYRAGPDGIEGTGDDNTFAAAGSILGDLAAYCDIKPIEALMIGNLMESRFVGVRSDAFRAVSVATLSVGAAGRCNVVCVFTRSGAIRYWGVAYSGMEHP